MCRRRGQYTWQNMTVYTLSRIYVPLLLFPFLNQYKGSDCNAMLFPKSRTPFWISLFKVNYERMLKCGWACLRVEGRAGLHIIFWISEQNQKALFSVSSQWIPVNIVWLFMNVPLFYRHNVFTKVPKLQATPPPTSRPCLVICFESRTAKAKCRDGARALRSSQTVKMAMPR